MSKIFPLVSQRIDLSSVKLNAGLKKVDVVHGRRVSNLYFSKY